MSAPDFYPTPMWVLRQFFDSAYDFLSEHLPPEQAYIVDPSAGDGRILDVLREYRDTEARRDVLANVEIHNGYQYDEEIISALGEDFLRWEPMWLVDMYVTNPPYSQAERFFNHAYETTTDCGIICFLLRMGFAAGGHRTKTYWSKPEYRPANMYILPHRPKFNDKGSDSNDYAWFVWVKGNRSSNVHWLPTVSKEFRKVRP